MTDSSGTWRIVEACIEPGDRAMLARVGLAQV